MAVQKWEYKKHINSWNENDFDLESELNQFGQDGWELVSVVGFFDPATLNRLENYYFKRPIIDD